MPLAFSPKKHSDTNGKMAFYATIILLVKLLLVLMLQADSTKPKLSKKIPQYYYLRDYLLIPPASSLQQYQIPKTTLRRPRILPPYRRLKTVGQQQSKQRNNSNSSDGTRPTGTAAALQLASTRKRVSYFRMDPQTEIRLNQVDGSLCTHVILAFARTDPLGNLVVASESDRTYLAEVSEFKRKFPTVKVMVSVFNEPEFNGFPRAANSVENRQRFARSTIEFLTQYNLDGIDLDWEFPNFPATIFAGREWERTGLTKIMRQLRSAIVENFYDRQVAEQHQLQQEQQKNSYLTGNNNRQSVVEPYLLTVAIAAQEAILRVSYELRQMANLCDWFNVMSYDYYLFKPYSPFTGPNSPLYPIVDSYVPMLNKLSLSWTVERLIGEEGIEPDKIVMGIPTYARAYRLMFKNTQAAPFTLAIGSKTGRIQDYLDYREVCDLITKTDTVVHFDKRARVPYLLTDDGYTWVSFENVQSVREKVRFIMDRGLAGYMTWNLNSDDFTGIKCLSKVQENGHMNNNAPISSDSLARTGIVLANTTNKEEFLRQMPNFPLHRAMFDELHVIVPGAN